MIRQPVYNYRVLQEESLPVLVIIDRYDEDYPTLTVTNGAEIVLKQIRDEIGTLPSLIIYSDSCGDWARLKVNDAGVFAGFAPIAPRHNGKALSDKEAISIAVAAMMIRERAGYLH